MLVTKYGQSEIAFGVTGRDIKCAGHKLAMIGRPYDHGQYIGWIPRGLFEEQVLNNYAMDGYGERYQTKARVRYQQPLEELTTCSWMVYNRELKKDDSRTLSCVRVPARVAETQKFPVHLILGMGFETKSGYLGVINHLGPDCAILKNTPLLSLQHLQHMLLSTAKGALYLLVARPTLALYAPHPASSRPPLASPLPTSPHIPPCLGSRQRSRTSSDFFPWLWL